MDKLIADLNKKAPSPQREALLTNATNNVYHDFKSSIAYPKMKLMEDVKAAGYRDVQANLLDGKYDDDF
jgi:hypothetical protein